MVFTLAEAFASIVELSFDVSTIFLDTNSWKNVFLGKLWAFQQCDINFNFLPKMVFGLLH